MDPNQALKNLRDMIRDTEDLDLIEQFEALDGWLSRGGFLPADWER